MSFITGLKDLGNIVDEAQEQANRKSVTWLGSLIKPGQTAQIRFVQELSEESPSYDPSRGLAGAWYEHSNPNDFKRSAACTLDDEGRCWACEQSDAGKKGWWKKPRFYINVLVDTGDGDPQVATWAMGVKRSATFAMIHEYAVETGSISNLRWKLKRTGEGTDTTWTLFPTTPDAIPFDWSGIELPNLEDAVRHVPYEDQEAFYIARQSQAEKPKVDTSSVPW